MTVARVDRLVNTLIRKDSSETFLAGYFTTKILVSSNIAFPVSLSV